MIVFPQSEVVCSITAENKPVGLAEGVEGMTPRNEIINTRDSEVGVRILGLVPRKYGLGL